MDNLKYNNNIGGNIGGRDNMNQSSMEELVILFNLCEKGAHKAEVFGYKKDKKEWKDEQCSIEKEYKSRERVIQETNHEIITHIRKKTIKANELSVDEKISDLNEALDDQARINTRLKKISK